MASSSQSYSLQIAERIYYTTGKDQLTRICVGGFALESAWHVIIEKKFLKTPPAVVRKSVLKAALFWPAIHFLTKSALVWAEWKIQKTTEERRGNKSAPDAS
ncbi:hypothetical protein F5B19DRAFT_262160 [Rostrohypoxylon terebratum]|nr:hypothetical protein F5B19DRAFT_262160 [Rostrohypoxylon terebratum]